MAPAVDVLERVVEGGKLRHGNHPVLAMAAGNAKVELEAAGNRKISKRRSQGRIDPLIAFCMALGAATRPATVVDIEWRVGRTLRNASNACANSSCSRTQRPIEVSPTPGRTIATMEPECRQIRCVKKEFCDLCIAVHLWSGWAQVQGAFFGLLISTNAWG